MKGVVIAGTGSGVGKTSITTGLLSLLSRNINVQAYKVGPDFIDPMYHSVATGRPGRNLDAFMMSKERIRNLVGYSAKDADICVVEGVRGLYEGLSGSTDECSTAEMAKTLGFPVVLVVNASSLTRSAAAIVKGFQAFDENVDIKGVIFNNISGEQHKKKLVDAMEKYTDVEIVGMIPKNRELQLRERYLGLKTVDTNDSESLIPLESMTTHIDTERLMEICESSKDPDLSSASPFKQRKTGIKVAIPKDEAFCFYYRENIECMEAAGMRISYFKPAEGEKLPDADMFYMGGGYPELHLKEISENKDFLEGIRTASEDGKPIIGECGGMMVMCSSITSSDGVKAEMAGIFNADARMSGRHGPMYMIADATKDNPLFTGTVKGHEFHYSDVVSSEKKYGFHIKRGIGINGSHDGMIRNNSIGSYMHQHALSTDDWLKDVISKVQ